MKVNHNCFISVIFFLFFCTIASLHADIVNPDVVQTAARRWISANAIFKAEQPDAKPKDAIRMTDADGKQLPLWHVPLTPSGYLIMAADDTLPPVVAFDTKATFSKSSPTPLPAMLDKQGSIFQEALKEPQTRGNTIAQDNQLRWKRLLSPTRADSVMPFTIITPPMLETEWNQDSPYNILSPSYIDYDRRSVTGCVPIAIAQILKYHEWPIAGIGTQIYKDVNGHLRATLKADFSFPFEWNLIENNYAMTDETNITTSELAVARLAMEMGVLVNANYEPRGTGASINKIKNYLYLYLGYSKDAQHDYFTSQDPLSMQILYMRLHDDMASKRPALVAIPDHLFVADGLGTIDNLDYYHFNYGWGGSENGWYLLTDGYEETIVNEAITNITPAPVPVFKQMSIEQNSTLMLSWDFPKQLKADMFRLTKTTEENSTIICSSIDGSERSYELTEQTGTNTYTLEAFIDGEWQTPSEGCTIKIVDNPAPLPVLACDEVLESIKGADVTTNITSNVPLAAVLVTSSRPDILPDNAITVTGDGTSWMLDIAPIQQAIGNVLLYLTATDNVGNIVKKTILVRLRGGESLYWFDYFDDALYEAEDTGKMILLVEDYDSWADYSNFCNDICEIDDIKEYLLENYVLWYARIFDWEASRFTSGLHGFHPYAVIIDPDDTSHMIRGICDPSADEFRMFLNLDTLIFSMDDDETYSPGNIYELEIFCDRKRAVIHYRLDAKTPTLEDPVYTDPITLTENTTISAQLFLGDEPIGKTVTKNYVFLPDLIWYNSLEEAFEIAKASEKLILLVEDFYSTSLDSSFCQEICEIVDIKKMLVENYVLWYVYSFYDEESYQFTSELYGGYPYIVIIDPVTSKRICEACDLSSDEFREFIDMDSLHFSLDAEEIYALGKIQELEISILQKQAVIHYRLDSNEPTTNDMVYTEPLSLTETTTVSARAFVNGEPVSDVVSKTYTFLPQIATPKLLASPSSFFTGSCLVTVSCDTPDVTIRYRTDGRSPSQSSPVFPEDGLTIDESCTVVVKAFKAGMKDSYTAECKLSALTELPEANAIISGKDVTMYSTDTPWSLQTDTFHSSPCAMQSAMIDRGKSTSLVLKVTGPGIISFYWKHSLDFWNTLSFSIDGIRQTSSYRENEWEYEKFTVSEEGVHYLTWTFSKDSGFSNNNDCAWIDDIVWKGFVSLNIDIEDAIGFGEYAKYDCKVTWSDDSVSSTLAWWALSSTEYANLYRNAYVINENKTGVNQTVTLNATVDFGDMTFSTSKDIFLSSGTLLQVATPILNVDETVYFSDNLYVTATCDTPNATIRYTLDGSIPMSFSPVFPENSLNITETSFLTVKAFRQDMKSSNPVQSKLISLTEMSSFSSGDGILFEFMDAPWFIQRKTFNSAPTALQSASINNSEKTSMIAKVTGPGILAFYWKASSEKSHDELSFSIDGVKQDKISGDTAWEQKCFTITGEGDHYLKWTYSKDSYISSYSDCAWVDDVSWIKAEDVTPTSAFEYSVENGVVTITKFIGNQTNVSIPASINGYPVVAIGDSAFESCTKLQTVVIPNGIINIKEEAFFYCSNLVSILLPNSISSIGVRTFAGCRKLESLTIPASVEVIGDFAFGSTVNLKMFLVDADNAEYVSQDGVLFSKDMSKLIRYPAGKEGDKYDIPDCVTHIGKGAFSFCSLLTSIHIPDGVLSIDSEAFQDCNNLENLILPDSITSISNSAFGFCPNLSSIVLPNKITSIERFTFNHCSGLKSIILPNRLTTINRDAFYSCTSLTSITIPESIESISSWAFVGCTNLKEVEFMGGVPSLNNDSFPTPITFYVLPGKGWENFEAPDGVTVVFIDLSPKLTLSLSLSRGWNLCSIPFTPNDESVAALKETGVCWGWVNGRFKLLETILAGQGFWIYAPSKRELLLKGEEAEPMPLHKGWNLIGPVGDDYWPQDVNVVWQLNRRYLEMISIEKNGQGLQPGKGYWIFIK